MLLYGYKTFMMAPNQEPEFSLLPVVGHVVGIGLAVILKFYYELSPEIGHHEAIHIMIRSKLWLFPGVIQGSLERRKRSALEASLIRRDELLSPQKVGSGALPRMFDSDGRGDSGGSSSSCSSSSSSSSSSSNSRLSSRSGKNKSHAGGDTKTPGAADANKLPMTAFLRSCHFPELRVLFSSMTTWPWQTLLSHPSRLGSAAEIDALREAL